jgi:hypothetical protein
VKIDVNELREMAQTGLRWTPSEMTITAKLARAVLALLNALAAKDAECERLRGAVLRPLTEREVQAALHEGRAEAMAATGDNAWTSLLKQRDELRQQLSAISAARDEACDIAERHIFAPPLNVGGHPIRVEQHYAEVAVVDGTANYRAKERIRQLRGVGK